MTIYVFEEQALQKTSQTNQQKNPNQTPRKPKTKQQQKHTKNPQQTETPLFYKPT